MARPNHRMNPTIHFTHINEGEYAHQTPQFAQDLYFPQWGFLDSRMVVPSIPSPTGTVNAVQNAPILRVAARTNATQSKRRVEQTQYDSSLQYLVPPGAQSYSENRNLNQIVDPITRLVNNDGPWNPHQMRNSDINVSHNAIQCPDEDFSHYRQARSDVDNVSDSGYQTQPAHSVLSNEPGDGGQELPMDFMLPMKNMNVNNAPRASHSMVRTTSDQVSVSQHSSRSGGHRQQFPCYEPSCPVVSKCASERKRHMLKHEKNFICGETDCKRAGKGFSTINDLDRHKRSVHKIGIEKSRSYQCAAASCANKTKLWPRLDNFKQHLDRIHKGEDMLDLIKRSEYYSQETPALQQSLSLDPALLAGMVVTNDGLSSNGSQAFSYQPSVSFHTSSFSSASRDSPVIASAKGSFSQLDMPSSKQGRNSLPTSDHLILPSHNRPSSSCKRRRLTEVSSTGTTSTSQAAPSSIRGCDMELDNGPQTKSEQQRQALEKLSKVVHIHGNQQQPGASHQVAPIVLSGDERRAIADLLKEQPRLVRSPQRRLTQNSASSLQYCDHEGCDFSGRPCDLKKHKKRHQKPYGCTFPKCHKRFGAKSDWKRHENSQHFQLEAYRCDHSNNAGKKCGHHCYRPTQFQKHLAEKHKVTLEEQVESSLKRCRIGKNYQGQFWCGFCGDIKILEKKRNDAWDERFNHIAIHFEKDMMPIDDWLCVEQDETKKELQNHMVDDDETNDVELEDLDDADVLQADVQRYAALGPGSTEQPEQQRQQLRIGRQCCQCNDHSTIIQVECFVCSHDFCNNCKRVYLDDADDGAFPVDSLM